MLEEVAAAQELATIKTHSYKLDGELDELDPYSLVDWKSTE